MLILSSLEGACAAFEEFGPARVVSLLSEDEAVPSFPGLADRAHLKLYVDSESCAAEISAAQHARAEALVDFTRNWDGAGDVLVHCKRGVSRSAAAAFIILCAMQPDLDERELLARVREKAPHADPCPLLVNYADELLGRDGAMFDALDDLPPPRTVIAAPVVTLPLCA